MTPLYKTTRQIRRAVLSGKPLEDRTVAELNEDAAELNIPLPSNARKDQIIAALRGEPMPASEPVEPNTADAEGEE